jgi:hypothetical protein
VIFRSRKSREVGGALAEAPRTEEVDGLLAEIAELSEANRAERDHERERRLLRLRHRAGVALAEGAAPTPSYPAPADRELPGRTGPELPEYCPEDLTPELLRASILRDGCMLVRGVVGHERAVEMAGKIDRVFADRKAQEESGASAALYEEFEPDPPYGIVVRPWIKEGGGVLAADSPELFFDMIDTFDRAGLIGLIGGYLGERPLISVDKCTLRKAEPSVPGAWHQDGSFMGEVRAMNVWLSLSHCGDDAPGLDLVPRRLDEFAESGGEGTHVDMQVSQATAERAAGEYGIIRPIFEPGDALLFDDRFLHQTGSDSSMPNPRFAIESWFFGPTGFSEGYVPLLA